MSLDKAGDRTGDAGNKPNNVRIAMATLDNQSQPYQLLLERISSTYAQGRAAAMQAVNVQLLQTYWQVGRHIVEFEQQGQQRAEYGKALLQELARDLCLRHGRGFNRSNLVYMRLFYLRYAIGEMPSHQLIWSHCVELLKIDDALERGFYEQQAIAERWSVAELKRQKSTALFLRLAASKDKEGVLQLARQGQQLAQPTDLLREPYVFEFLKIPEPWQVSETQLETLLCQHLQQFLLELGKGFTFVGRQVRITVNNEHYRVDLVFYHRILRCFVLIDLKIGQLTHQDIGQMDMYVRMYDDLRRNEGDNPTVGILLCGGKDQSVVRYSVLHESEQLFASKYRLVLPSEEELRKEIERERLQFKENQGIRDDAET